MSYDMLVAKLRTPRWVPFSNKYYASVAQQLELFIVDRTDEERDNLKGELVRFALYWYADLTDDPRCRANPGEFALLPEFDALPEFVDKVRAAGYDYPEWDAVLKSFKANKLLLMRSNRP